MKTIFSDSDTIVHDSRHNSSRLERQQFTTRETIVHDSRDNSSRLETQQFTTRETIVHDSRGNSPRLETQQFTTRDTTVHDSRHNSSRLETQQFTTRETIVPVKYISTHSTSNRTRRHTSSRFMKSTTGMLKRMRDNIPEEHYKLYYALFESHMTNCMDVFGIVSKTCSEKLLKI